MTFKLHHDLQEPCKRCGVPLWVAWTTQKGGRFVPVHVGPRHGLWRKCKKRVDKRTTESGQSFRQVNGGLKT